MEDLHEKAGLVPAGKDEDGEQEWLGTQEAWDRYDELESLRDQ